MRKYAFLVALLGLNSSLFAQGTESHRGDRQIERMKTELASSEEQYLKIKKAHEDFTDQMERAREDTSATRQELMKTRKEGMDARNQAFKEILTKEQFQKWMAMKPERPRGERARPSDPNEAIKKELGLTDEQAAKLKSANAAMIADFRKLRSDSTITDANRPAEQRKIVQARNEKVRKILTKDQYEKFLAYQSEMAELRKRGQRDPGRR